MDVMKLQELHDRLIASRPEGAECPADCPFCSGEYASYAQGGPDVSDKTYTEDELSAAVAKATETLSAELDAFKTSAETAEVEARIEAAKTESAAKIAELETRIDALTVEAEAAKTERDAVTTWLEAEAQKVVHEAEAAQLLESRLAQIAEVITFPPERIEERKSTWASLSDEQFEQLVADYKALGEKKAEGELPSATAMLATREGAGSNGGSAVADLIRQRNFGVNVRDAR